MWLTLDENAADAIFSNFFIDSSPVWGRERSRISPPRFLTECCKRQLNQGSFVLMYFRLFTFPDLYWVCLSVFSCTVLFVSISQVIGCKDRLRNDSYCVQWGIKLYSNQPFIGSNLINAILLVKYGTQTVARMTTCKSSDSRPFWVAVWCK